MSITPAVPDPPELDYVLWEGFGPVDVAYDIGANCGQTIHRIRAFSGLVVAFEPAAESFRYLTDHFSFISNLVLVNQAVSSHVGTVDLVAMQGKIETGQLVTAGTPGMEWSEDAASGEVRHLPCVTVDQYCLHTGLVPGFLKIDVEGHEGEVLAGASQLLQEDPPQMLIEIHSEDLGNQIYDLLKRRYSVELVRHPHYEPGSLLWRTHFWFRAFPTHAF